MEQLTSVALNAVLSVLAVVATVAVRKFKSWLEAKAGLEGVRTVEIIAKNAVNTIEQISKDKDIRGREKYENAKNLALEALNANGINVSQVELSIAIESAVKQMNDAWTKGEAK